MMRMFGLTLIAFIAGCSDAGVLGGVEKPDLGYTLIEASNQNEMGLKPQLLYERCERLKPIVEPVRQRWSCRFGFKTSKGEQDCSATVSVHADDHTGIWKPDIGDLDPVSGKTKPNLICKRRQAASNVRGLRKPQNCSVKPAEFLHWSDPRLDEGVIGIEPLNVNVIKVERSGLATWNEANITHHHGFEPTLGLYLSTVAQIKPESFTALDFDRGAPCESIKIVRSLMNKYLNCARSHSCVQGPIPARA